MKPTFLKSFSKEVFFSIFFAGVALVSLSLFFFPQQTTQSIQQKIKGEKIQSIPSPLPTLSSTPVKTKKNVEVTTTEEEVVETKIIQITIAVTPTPKTVSHKATLTVNVTGSSSFSIEIDKGKNQCDVLQLALQEKKISQLLMKYDTSLQTNGVYQINNIGKDNAIWWTYEVNGKSPTQGCNNIAANDGDTVSWKYIGS